jgi:hypothetical protein
VGFWKEECERLLDHGVFTDVIRIVPETNPLTGNIRFVEKLSTAKAQRKTLLGSLYRARLHAKEE